MDQLSRPRFWWSRKRRQENAELRLRRALCLEHERARLRLNQEVMHLESQLRAASVEQPAVAYKESVPYA